jgi:hypothetical protein
MLKGWLDWRNMPITLVAPDPNRGEKGPESCSGAMGETRGRRGIESTRFMSLRIHFRDS